MHLTSRFLSGLTACDMPADGLTGIPGLLACLAAIALIVLTPLLLGNYFKSHG
jgi:hypothetical protein